MHTLLILSVGSLVGTNILDAIERFRPRLRVVGMNSEAHAPNNFRCDKVYLANPAADARGYWERVHEVLCREQPDLVFAGRDDDVSLMASWRELHPQWAHALVCGPLALAAAMTDKLAGYHWATERSLQFAPTVSAGANDAPAQCAKWMAELGGALIAKPRLGNGSRGVRLLLDEVALQAALGDDQMVIQPYLADAQGYRTLSASLRVGVPLFWTPTLTQYVTQTVIGPKGEVLGRFDMQASMVGGRCMRALPWHDSELARLGDRCAAQLAEAGWRGPVNLQWVHHAKLGYQAIEFCARVAGGMMPRLLLGFDEMALCLGAWTGESFTRSDGFAANSIALRTTRDVALDDHAAKLLAKSGAWP